MQHGVFGAQHPAPGLADEMVAVRDPEVSQEVVELGQEQLHRPEIRAAVRQMRGFPVPQLVVMHDPAAVRRQILEAVDVVVGAARPAMHDHHGRPRAAQVARDPVPGFEAAERCPALGDLHASTSLRGLRTPTGCW